MRALGAVALLLLAVAVGPVAPASAADRIEGTWNYGGGRVKVEPTGPGTYRGTVIAATRFLACEHPVGERMWQISGAATGYAGTHQWFLEGSCLPAPGGKAIWVVREENARFLLDFCTAPPNQGEPVSSNPSTVCTTLERAKPPAQPATQVCVLGTCLGGAADTQTIGCVRRGALTHRFPVRLRTRGNRRMRGMRVRVVVFRLDGRRIGRKRRRPFTARVRGARLTPGPHVLSATVTLRQTRRAARGKRPRTARTVLKYTFRACD